MNINNTNNTNVLNSDWSSKISMVGVKPPMPSVVASDNFSYLSESANPDYFLITINSRSPYASEFLVTKYGSVQTRLGTSIGTK